MILRKRDFYEMIDWSDVPHREKIKALFEYRGIPEFIRLGGITEAAFEYHLYKLQASIYELDQYLETVWELDDDRIAGFWSEMKTELDYFVPDQSKHDQYLYQISVYLKREKGLRTKSFPLHTTLDYFYYYKSCDVRLMRRLIHDHSRTNRAQLHPRNWLLYDYVTEVNDDVDDLIEDLDMYNCNRLLLDVYVNGVGIAKTSFQAFLADLKQRNDNYKGSAKVQKDTYRVIEETSALLTKNLKLMESVDFQSHIMFSKY